MEYRIILERMEFRALHGCYELERKVGNRFTVDLELTAELGDVAKTAALMARTATAMMPTSDHVAPEKLPRDQLSRFTIAWSSAKATRKFVAAEQM